MALVLGRPAALRTLITMMGHASGEYCRRQQEEGLSDDCLASKTIPIPTQVQ